MAARDILPVMDPNGGTPVPRWNQMTASEVFEIGEPVAVVNAGTLTEPPDDATQFIVTDIDGGTEAGIACFGPGAGNINPVTGAAFAALDDIAYWPFGEGTIYKTSNVFAAGAGSDVAPAQTDVGEPYQMSYNTTATIGWGFEQTAALSGIDVQCIVIEVLDADNEPIRISGAAGTQALFVVPRPTLAAA